MQKYIQEKNTKSNNNSNGMIFLVVETVNFFWQDYKAIIRTGTSQP